MTTTFITEEMLKDIDFTVRMTRDGEAFEAVHVFDEEQMHAVNAALASRRPLLIKGEPGVGKSQLARAAATLLKRVYIPYTVSIQTEATDLLWALDSVRRLAEAQIAGATGGRSLLRPDDVSGRASPGADMDISAPNWRALVENELGEERFVVPGPIWWAFNWTSAERQAGLASIPPRRFDEPAHPDNGCVLLIDEIDKAETDVPNGLLEVLGAGQFRSPSSEAPVTAEGEYPLVVVTTNEERVLPEAFVRRCMVLHLNLDNETGAFKTTLERRGAVHFPKMKPSVLAEVAQQVWSDRDKAKQDERRPFPGQAEFMDILRALDALRPGDERGQLQLLCKIKDFALKKNSPEH
ncbi:MAG: AAA family ATPase [Alphaproteobacteria bacterium]